VDYCLYAGESLGIKSATSNCLASGTDLRLFLWGQALNELPGTCGQYVVGIKLAGVEYNYTLFLGSHSMQLKRRDQ
jgi:hypothetical protein